MTVQKERGLRKERTGVVVSNKMAKTLVVAVDRTIRHPLYGKVMKSTKKYYAHAQDAQKYNVGDKVTMFECRPLSKLKRWCVIEEGKTN